MKTMKIETIELSVPQRRLMEIFAKDLNEGDFGDKRIRLLLEYLRELLADERHVMPDAGRHSAGFGFLQILYGTHV